jgi:hypothetical protein
MEITIDERFLDGLNVVFNQKQYLSLAIVLALGIGFFYAVSSNLIYLQPIIFFNYYNLVYEGFANFITGVLFLVAVPILASLTLTLIVYKLNQFRKLSIGYKEAGMGTMGMFAGLFTSTCPECVPLFLYSAGVSYSLFVAVIAPYLIWLRFLAIVILAVSFYYASREVTNLCSIKSKKKERG